MLANPGTGAGIVVSNQSAAVEYGWEENLGLSLASCVMLHKDRNEVNK